MMTTLLRRGLAALILAGLSPLAAATLAPISFESPLTDETFTIRMQLTTAGGVAVAGATVNFTVNATGNATAALVNASAVTDAQGVASVQAVSNDWAGTYLVNAMSGPDTASVAVTNRVKRAITIQDPVYGFSSIQIATDSATCVIKSYQRLAPQDAPGGLEQLPPGRAPQAGFVQFKLARCDTPNVGVKLRLADNLPAGAEVWIYSKVIGRPDIHWHRASSEAINGGEVAFSVSDMTDSDDDLLDNDEIRVPLVGALVPAPYAYPLVQDIWWAGTIENGWGMSIVQHNEKLFCVIYAYDDAGKPTWFAMPAGTWNAARNTFSGPLYLPKGGPYYEYDRLNFEIRPPVGNMSVAFSDNSHATLTYTINGKSGTKTITRQAFSTSGTPTLNGLTDMWWGGELQNGWGIAVLQQHAKLFIVWFTYDSEGKATWFFMPAGDWTAFSKHEGKIYTATGSPWVGVPYDPSKLVVTESGKYTFTITGTTGTFVYEALSRSGMYTLSRQQF